ncbi:hypothetical protein ABIB90_007304 [Bradyrhizobium sp. JR4.1]|uniref:hypothetical protein n=1 Tax=unclassified Bradyrhizobium TaxID=2631580 RepID=UPI0004884454
MMYLDKPPQLVEPREFSSMPAQFRRPDVSWDWADANRGGHLVDGFIEGPSFDKSGNLYVVDTPSAAFTGFHQTAPGL